MPGPWDKPNNSIGFPKVGRADHDARLLVVPEPEGRLPGRLEGIAEERINFRRVVERVGGHDTDQPHLEPAHLLYHVRLDEILEGRHPLQVYVSAEDRQRGRLSAA